MDVLGLSLVTIGAKASLETQRLFEAGEYTKYLYLHGLGVETAEALAEFHHRAMRQELGIDAEDSPHIRDLFHQKYRGSRYSFGYPACPNLEDQTKLFALLHPGRECRRAVDQRIPAGSRSSQLRRSWCTIRRRSISRYRTILYGPPSWTARTLVWGLAGSRSVDSNRGGTAVETRFADCDLPTAAA